MSRDRKGAGKRNRFLAVAARWRIGDIALPGLIVSEIDMPAVSRSYRLDGLLGSDVLSRFGAILIDYDGQILELRGAPTGRGG